MKTIDVKKEALRKAHKLREEFRKRGEFKQQDFRRALSRRLKSCKEAAYEALVDLVAEQLDKEPIDKEPRQGLLFDMEGEYKLGEGRRIAKRLAQYNHAQDALKLDDANVKNVLEANKWKHEEMERLRPFWLPGMTKQEAVGAYREANPQEEEGAA